MAMNRREFLGSAAMVAASAAAGIRSRVRTHGPVNMDFTMWSSFTVPCILSSDESRDLFHIRLLTKEVPEIHAEVKLSEIRRSLEGDGRTMVVRTWNKFTEENSKIRAFVSKGSLNFFPVEGYDSTPPAKLHLADVRRVVS
jgi:hypothetical protein